MTCEHCGEVDCGRDAFLASGCGCCVIACPGHIPEVCDSCDSGAWVMKEPVRAGVAVSSAEPESYGDWKAEMEARHDDR